MNRIQRLYTLATQRRAAAIFAAVLAFAAFGCTDAMASGNSHKGKKGELRIAAATEVGGILLQPGEYEVREVKSENGPAVEFTHTVHNELASELVQADEEEVVARVPSVERTLSAPSKHTQLMLTSNAGDATGLEIRGSEVDYLFTASQMAGKREATVVCTNGGVQ